MPTEPLFVPLELVDLILLQIVEGWGYRKALSGCSLVSRAWLELTRYHRYKRFRFVLRHPSEITLGRIFDTHAKPDMPLLEIFRMFPAICPHIHCLELSPSSDLVTMFNREDDYKAGITLAWLVDVLNHLPSLERLHLPNVIRDRASLCHIQSPVIPRLDYLEMLQPPIAQSAVSPGELRGLLNLVGTISVLSLRYLRVTHGQRNDELGTISSRTNVLALRVDDHTSCSATLFKTLAALPSADRMTELYLGFVPPEDISQLGQLISMCSPTLERLALQLEGYKSTNSTVLDASHYLQLDLSQCVLLHTVSLKMRFYIPDRWCWIKKPMNECKAAAYVVSFLQQFALKPIPNLSCLDFKICGTEDLCRVSLASFDEFDEIVVRYCEHGPTKVTMTSWWPEGMAEDEWEIVSALFPKLLKHGLLKR